MPCHRLLGATREPFVPDALHLVTEAGKRLRVPGDPVVPEVPLQLLAQALVLLPQWLVAEPPAPIRDAPERTSEAVAGGPSLDAPPTSSRSSPVVCESQEVERARPTVSARAVAIVPARRSKRDQSGLVGVQREAVLGEPLVQHDPHSTSIVLARESEHRIVGESDQ